MIPILAAFIACLSYTGSPAHQVQYRAFEPRFVSPCVRAERIRTERISCVYPPNGSAFGPHISRICGWALKP